MRLVPAIALLALIAAVSAAGALEARLERAGEAVLSDPRNMELSEDGTRLYVADKGNDRIAVLDAESLDLVGSFAAGALNRPHDIDRGADGAFYIADSGNDRIAIFRLEGAFARQTGSVTGPFRDPEGVLALPDGGIVVTGTSGNIAVVRNGRIVAVRDGLSTRHDVEGDAEGRIWAADSNNGRVIVLDAQLNRIGEFSGPAYGFRAPRYLSLGDDATLWVADKFSHRVLAIDTGTGAVKLTIGRDSTSGEERQLSLPQGVVVRGDSVWIADSGNNRVLRYRIAAD